MKPLFKKTVKPVVVPKVEHAKPKTETATAKSIDYLGFMQAEGIDVTWHKIVSQSANSPDQLSVTVSHGSFDVGPKGNSITRATLGEALTELKSQIDARANPTQVTANTASTITKTASA